jgi:transketolase
MTDFRPADANETAAAWRLALERTGAELLCAQPAGSAGDRSGHARRLRRGQQGRLRAGGCTANPQVVLIGTGSEVWPAWRPQSCWPPRDSRARGQLPELEDFEEQTAEYKASVLPAGVPKLAVEAGATLGWWKYVGLDGDVIGLDRLGLRRRGRR